MDPVDGYTRTTEPDGTTVEEYRQNGELHRDDGPARIEHDADGSVIEGFYRNGKLHREDGPAYVLRTADGSTTGEYYYRNGNYHRDGGPAVIEHHADGSLIENFYRNGKLHRDGGPASINRYTDGSSTEEWWHHDELDRADGPAVVQRAPDGTIIEQIYCRDGFTHRNDGPAIIENKPDGTKTEHWYRNGWVHRDDGPAITALQPDGTRTEEYYRDGGLHRDDGPAQIDYGPDGLIHHQSYWHDGTQLTDVPQRETDPLNGYTRKTEPDGTVVEEYREHGELHRDVGPAYIERASDKTSEQYYRHGKLHRDDGPALITEFPNGGNVFSYLRTEEYYRQGQLHRDDGPALIKHTDKGSSAALTEEYYQNGLLHRDNGPAITHIRPSLPYSFARWYLHGNTHREDGPAYIETFGNGTRSEKYYRNGKLHRDDGPAEIDYRPDGLIYHQSFWRDGTQQEHTQPNPINFYVVEYRAVEPFTDDGHDYAAGEIFYQELSWGFTRDEADRDARNVSPRYLDGPFKDALLKSVANNSYNVRDATAEERNQFQEAHGGPYATYEHVLHQALQYYNHTCKTDRPPVLQNDQGDYLPATWTQFFDRHVWPLKEKQLAQEPARTTPEKPNCYMIDYVATEPFTYKDQHYEPGQLFHQEPTWRQTRDQAETDAANPYGYFGAYQDALQKSAERNSYSVRAATPEEAKKYAQNLLQSLPSDPPDTYEHVLHQALEYYLHTRNYSAPVLLSPDGDAHPVTWEEFFDEVVWPRREHERLAELAEKQHDRVIGQIKELEHKYKDPSTSGPDKERIESYLNRTQEHAENLRKSAADEKQPERPLTAIEKIVADAKRHSPEQQQDLQEQQELERQRQKDRDRER